jgi:hypothetical protein
MEVITLYSAHDMHKLCLPSTDIQLHVDFKSMQLILICIGLPYIQQLGQQGQINNMYI